MGTETQLKECEVILRGWLQGQGEGIKGGPFT